MRLFVRLCVLLSVLSVAGSPLAHAQQQTGEIFGKVTDQSSAVMPGVTVTVTGSVLLQPLTAVTSDAERISFRGSRSASTSSGSAPRLQDGRQRERRVTVVQRKSTPFSASRPFRNGDRLGSVSIVDTKDTGTKQTF